MRQALVVIFLAVGVLVACNSSQVRPEKLGTTTEAIGSLAQGDPCNSNSQCTSGFCVDTVCCDSQCGDDTHADNMACSNVYGVVAGLTPGTCHPLVPGDFCGQLTSLNPCKWRGTKINGGGKCPVPNVGLDNACYTCGPLFGNKLCPPGLPVCDAATGGCGPCNANFPGGVGSCPTAGFPVCKDGACVQCDATHTASCVSPTGSCDPVNNVCVGCDGNFSSGSTFHCPQLKPVCLGSGACVECNAAEPDFCPTLNKVCDTSADASFDTCVQCNTFAECASLPATPVCTNHVCSACTTDRVTGASPECPTAALPACVGGACKPCNTTPQCAGTQDPAGRPTPVCDAPNHNCVQCTSPGDCAAVVPAAPFCVANKCVSKCATDLDCGGATPKCSAAGVCVQCLTDAPDCGGATPFCVGNSCWQCKTAANCTTTPTTPVCVPNGGGDCVACNGNSGSLATAPCATNTSPACKATGECVECTAGPPGVGGAILCTGAKSVCNTATDKCVECTAANPSACTGAKPICDTANGVCVPCNGDKGKAATFPCQDPNVPACVAGKCVECSPTDLDACPAGLPVCLTTTNKCVQCLNNTQCTGPNGVCNTITHECVLGCTSDANCTIIEPACKLPDQFCVQCTATNKTACVGATPVCDVSKNKCVACVTGADCPAAKPICDSKTKTCIAECTASSQCPGDAPVCDPATKHCVECDSNTDCKEPKPICDTTTHTCGTTCTKSSECPGDTPICDPKTKKCVDCTNNGDCPPSDPICNTTTNKCGKECSKSSECPGDTPICDPNTKSCVQCTDDTMCPSDHPLCDGTTLRCVEDVSIEGGGCSCSTVPSRGRTTVPLLLGLGLVVAAIARRRREQHPQ